MVTKGGGAMTKEDRIGRDRLIKKKENRDREKEELLDVPINAGTVFTRTHFGATLQLVTFQHSHMRLVAVVASATLRRLTS